MRILFCGGGTAGHVNPALAMAQTVMRNSKDNKVAYVVTAGGIENQLVDFKKYQIDVIGLKRKLSLKNVSFLYKQIKAIDSCKKIIDEFHPNVIFGTGGYATYPVILAGHKKGIKTVLHESNVLPGKAILALEKYANHILVNFEESKKHFKHKEKVLCVGNPLRQGFEVGNKQEVKKSLGIKKKYVILCTSGSLGAERINNAAIEIIENIIRQRTDVYLILSTGKKEYTRVKKLLDDRGLKDIENVLVSDYFHNMSQLIAVSDIVISRAGALTISELAYTKKATILVPSPNVANNHQYLNALALENTGATILIKEDRLYLLVDTIKELLDNEKKRVELENNIEAYSKKDANKTIFSLLSNI